MRDEHRLPNSISQMQSLSWKVSGKDTHEGEQLSKAGQLGRNLAVAGNWTQLEDLGNSARSTVCRISLVGGEAAEFPVMRGMVQHPSSWKK